LRGAQDEENEARPTVDVLFVAATGEQPRGRSRPGSGSAGRAQHPAVLQEVHQHIATEESGVV